MSRLPKWIPPMRATLYKKEPFNSLDWIFEKKLDGERCLVYFDGKDARMMTRNKKEVSDQYPEIAEQIYKLSKKAFIIDGEIVIKQGKMGSFEQMQHRMGVQKPSKKLQKQFPLFYYVFDILFFDGEKLKNKPLNERKKILKKLNFPSKIQFMPHENKNGKTFTQKMRKQHYEGAIAKKKRGTYKSSRSKDWLKLKIQNGQELVIGGYTEPQGRRKGFGALLVGFYCDDRFVYAGKVGTGYSDEELNKLHKKLQKLKRKTSPFEDYSPDRQNVHWVSPKLVAEFKFTEWTDQNKLRHPAYAGLREDKNPKKVVKEG